MLLGTLIYVIVCSCNAVFERTVHQAVAGGAKCVDSIGDQCGAGRDCGTCISHLEEILEEFDRSARRSTAA